MMPTETFTPFSCRTRFVDSRGLVLKTTFCSRRYLDYPGLHDVLFKAAVLGREDTGLETALRLSAVSFENARRLARRHLEGIEWAE